MSVNAQAHANPTQLRARLALQSLTVAITRLLRDADGGPSRLPILGVGNLAALHAALLEARFVLTLLKAEQVNLTSPSRPAVLAVESATEPGSSLPACRDWPQELDCIDL